MKRADALTQPERDQIEIELRKGKLTRGQIAQAHRLSLAVVDEIAAALEL